MDPEQDPGGPKRCGPGGSGSGTLITFVIVVVNTCTGSLVYCHLDCDLLVSENVFFIKALIG